MNYFNYCTSFYRPPFCGQPHYINMKNNLLKLALEIVTSSQRDRFVENPLESIFEIAKQLAQLADHIIQESQDSLILQPATLDVATLKKRSGESLVICVSYIYIN